MKHFADSGSGVFHFCSVLLSTGNTVSVNKNVPLGKPSFPVLFFILEREAFGYLGWKGA